MLHCKDCSLEFVFTVREQRFFAEKGSQVSPCGVAIAGLRGENFRRRLTVI